MKTKTSKQPKQAKPATQVKDLEPKEDPKGGGGFGWDRITSYGPGNSSPLIDSEDPLTRK